MTTLELKLNLPDELVQRAQSAGLLTPQAIEGMLREQLKRQAGERLRTMWTGTPQEPITPQVEQEIVEVVREVKAEQRKQSGR